MHSAVMDSKNVLKRATMAIQPMMVMAAAQRVHVPAAAAILWFKLFLKPVTMAIRMLAEAAMPIVLGQVRARRAAIQTIAQKQSSATTVPQIAVVAATLIVAQPAWPRFAAMVKCAARPSSAMTATLTLVVLVTQIAAQLAPVRPVVMATFVLN